MNDRVECLWSVRSRVPACSRSRPMCRARARRRASRRCSSSRPTRRRSARARRRSRPIAAVGRHLQDYPDGASTELREAIGRAFGLDPSRIVCGAGSDEMLEPAGARLSAGRRRGDPHDARLPGLSDRDARRGRRRRWWRRRRTYTADVDAILAGVTRAHADRVPGEPEQSDRHLRAVRRGQAPARRPAEARAARASMRPTPNTCGATTTSPASSWWRPPRTS